MKVAFTLIAEGSSDEALIPALKWAIRQDQRIGEIDAQMAFPHLLPPSRYGLQAKIRRAVELFPADLFIVHRDSDRESPDVRFDEIGRAAGKLHMQRVVPVVPVRMTEAWLLVDEDAIRSAAGNPRGTVALADLPGSSAIERVADPKLLLRRLLRTASGLRGRKLDKFDERAAVRRVSERIRDFSPLRHLSSFVRFEQDLAGVLASLARSVPR
jgi:Domain of unknown function (DUF4276)